VATSASYFFAPVDGNESKRPIEQIASVLSVGHFPLPHKFSTADIDEDACNPLDVEEVYSPPLACNQDQFRHGTLCDSHGELQEFCVPGRAPPAMEFTVKAWGERSCADVWTRSGAPAWPRYLWT
jgi:hypothetical protein